MEKSRKVLVVDDDTEMLDYAAMLVKRMVPESKVETASDGREGWRKLKEFHPDLLIIDLKLPEIYGFDICAKIRLDPNFKDLKVMVMSSYGQPRIAKMAMDSGANEFLLKPFQSDDFIKKVGGLL